MDLRFDEADLEFREEVRTWLAEHVPREARPPDGPEMRAFDLEWQRTQHDAGYAGIAWPAEYGGLGLSLQRQLVWHEEYARAGGPDVGVCFVGLNHGGPTLIERGTDEQKRVHLPQILRGEVVWCQGFSEPGSGSDLASLRTRAELDGGELVVTGQKIWTSYADHARWQELLVRTDPTSTRHRGITWVICDMHSPGIEVRPIATMDGSHHFCEVFYDEVRIPVSNVVGDIDDGWSVAMSTLGFERGSAFASAQVELSIAIGQLIDEAAERPGPLGRGRAIDDDELATRLATAKAECDALRAMTYLGVSRSARGGLPGPEGSIVRCYLAELTQRVAALALEVVGADRLRLGSYEDGWTREYLHSFAETIGGGTAEIQREIIAERVLSLPRGR